MTEWFIADTHFGHSNILKFENRPYSSIEEMEQELIKAWNSKVKNTDTVYIVGDFCFKGYNKWVELLTNLNGVKILIKGNHDKDKLLIKLLNAGCLKEVHTVGEFIKRYDIGYFMTHYPLALGERGKVFNIHGHIHSQKSDYKDQINVGVDSEFMSTYYLVSEVPFGTPVPLEYIDGYVSVLNEKLITNYHGKED